MFDVVKTDLQALHLSGTYCHKTGTRTPSCNQAPADILFQIENVELSSKKRTFYWTVPAIKGLLLYRALKR